MSMLEEIEKKAFVVQEEQKKTQEVAFKNIET